MTSSSLCVSLSVFNSFFFYLSLWHISCVSLLSSSTAREYLTSAIPHLSQVQIASELYPDDPSSSKPNGVEGVEDDDDDEEEDLEKALAKELSELKKPRTETRFGTSTFLIRSLEDI